jgi:hypothetical protein
MSKGSQQRLLRELLEHCRKTKKALASEYVNMQNEKSNSQYARWLRDRSGESRESILQGKRKRILKWKDWSDALERAIKDNMPIKKRIYAEWKPGYGGYWDYEERKYCPNCGEKTVWCEDSSGDCHVGPTYLCLACEEEGRMWYTEDLCETLYKPVVEKIKAELKNANKR